MMNTQIDFRTLPSNVPVLCIPRVYPNISESRIRRIFDDLNMGILERIDIVSKASDKGEKFNRVFVHFKRWNDSENANIARERLLNGKEIKIIYDEPWFWKISAYREVERRPPIVPQNVSQRRPGNQFEYNGDRYSNGVRSYNRPEPRRTDERPNYNSRYYEGSRERPMNRDYSRERCNRQRDDLRETRRPEERKVQEEKPKYEMKKEESRTPSCSPPRRRDDSRERPVKNLEQAVDFSKIDYGPLPPMRKRNFGAAKKPLKIEDEKEEGEITGEDDKDM